MAKLSDVELVNLALDQIAQTNIASLNDGSNAAAICARNYNHTLRAVLRAGAYELMQSKDVPVKVVVSEYVDLAGAFLDKDEIGMVNAVLDRLAREVRAEEIARAP